MDYNRYVTFESRIKYVFNDKNLLETALTHPSSAMGYNYERLEFLGDAVIELIVSDVLYTQYADYTEGMLTQVRSKIVCSKSLASIARSINLGAELKLGKGEEQTGGRKKESILENALEAVMGAIYLDGGYTAAKTVVYSLFENVIKSAMGSRVERDYKSQLQELVRKRLKKEVNYTVTRKEGLPHELTFYVRLNIADAFTCEGSGHSKKEAEQNAAKFALSNFENIV